jgi:hypothetical protein
VDEVPGKGSLEGEGLVNDACAVLPDSELLSLTSALSMSSPRVRRRRDSCSEELLLGSVEGRVNQPETTTNDI